jgi:hypothetical protein
VALNFAKLVIGPCLTAFGGDWTYTPLKSDPGIMAFVFRGIFEAKHEMIEVIDGAQHSTQCPVVAVRLADLPIVPAKGDELTIEGRDYRIWDVQPDGQGKADLVLRFA